MKLRSAKCDVIAKKQTQFVDLPVQSRRAQSELLLLFVWKEARICVSEYNCIRLRVCISLYVCVRQPTRKSCSSNGHTKNSFFFGVKALRKYQSNDKINNNKNNINRGMQWRICLKRVWTFCSLYARVCVFFFFCGLWPVASIDRIR